MVQLIIGKKGEGKTPYLLEKANDSVQVANGNIVYLDKSTKRMYDLHNKIRLINVNEFPIADSHEFLGFLCGIISQDGDLEQMFLDSFLTIASMEKEELPYVLKKLDQISETFKVNFVLSVSVTEEDLPETDKSKVILSI